MWNRLNIRPNDKKENKTPVVSAGPDLYKIERELAHKNLAGINADIPSIIFDYLGAADPSITIKDAAYLMLAEDILGHDLPKGPNAKDVYLQKVKEIVLSIACNTTAHEEPFREKYRMALDTRLQSINNFPESLHVLINTFIYDPICQGQMTHNNPINNACWQSTRIPIEQRLYLLQQLLEIEGIDVNAYDAPRRFNKEDKHIDRLAPIHNLIAYNHSENKDTIIFLEELLKHGANINLKTTKEKQTALHIAASRCKTDLIRYLLTIPNIELLSHDARGKTPIDLARVTYKSEARDETLKILEDAIKQSDETGAKRKRLSHHIEKSLFGNYQKREIPRVASLGAVEAVCRPIGRAIGFDLPRG